MKTARTAVSVVVTMSFVLCGAGVAQGDWDVSDGHKMHFPQLPDHDGWDVEGLAGGDLADDWLCTSTGPVQDIHIWFSEETDQPPDLEINQPGENETVYQSNLEIKGKTESSEIKITVNDRLVVLEKEGEFNYLYELSEGENLIKVIAQDSAGNETEKELAVTYRP